MGNNNRITLIVFIVFLLNSFLSGAQLSAPGSAATTNTTYPVFPEADPIFIFCTTPDVTNTGSLQAETTGEGTAEFIWEKYNPDTGEFDDYFTDMSITGTSTIASLPDGGYRVTVSTGDTTWMSRAWIFNAWITVSAEITESTCDFLTLAAYPESSPFIYYDPAGNTAVELHRNLEVEWQEEQTKIAGVPVTRIFDPPIRNTWYNLRVFDQFGCEIFTSVEYNSIVTRAKFTPDQMDGEAPLTVTFNNESENGDPGLYEWFFYRNFDDLKRESETSQGPIDSIMVVAYNDIPIYIYEKSGMYKVKLVSKKTSSFNNQTITCVDTAYMDEFIVVDTSFVDVPNVITPNGDGINDQFIVKFWSMQSIKISIFNRWGKRIHFWESGNVRGFDQTYTETVWDGRIGNRYASPGVYFYVIDGRGRDDKRRKAHGFFHLFNKKE
ncbi:MAG: gliding motility-associated C-terminal domain-containing protein [Mariniphaga sp.]